MNDAKLLLGGFTELAHALAAAPDEDTRFKVAVDAAVDLVTRCDHAGLTSQREWSTSDARQHGRPGVSSQ